MIDFFALVVLIILIAFVISAWVLLAMWPGQIARQRNHPQAEAINVMGWWGAITMGILAPIAWVWAYTNPAPGSAKLPQPEAEPEAPTDEEVTS